MPETLTESKQWSYIANGKQRDFTTLGYEIHGGLGHGFHLDKTNEKVGSTRGIQLSQGKKNMVSAHTVKGSFTQ